MTKVSTKDRIFQASMLLFSQHGYDGTSVQDICQHAEVSKGAFYHHFQSKQALFLGMMDEWIKLFTAEVVDQQPGSLPVPEYLLALNGRISMAFDAAPHGFPILMDFWRQAILDETIWHEALTPYRHFQQFFEQLVRKGIAEGSLKRDTDPSQAAFLLIAFFMGYLLQAALYRDAVNWPLQTAYGLGQLLDGMRSKS
ncbi:MAG TPA: TetR/AcrR family transcriptional regulator [Anaerolineaceae bacterium]|nr:TetR/AcrR family transcriptional regulator [Anaerolineaceae bacterium]